MYIYIYNGEFLECMLAFLNFLLKDYIGFNLGGFQIWTSLGQV